MNTPTQKAPTACPTCKAAATDNYTPFCSKRCADVDLHKWLNESYAIPAVDDDSEGAQADRDRE